MNSVSPSAQKVRLFIVAPAAEALLGRHELSTTPASGRPVDLLRLTFRRLCFRRLCSADLRLIASAKEPDREDLQVGGDEEAEERNRQDHEAAHTPDDTAVQP